MNSLFILFLLNILFFNYTYCQYSSNLKEVDNFGSNPGNLKMFVFNTSQNDSSKLPLVVVLHGCGQNAEDAAELTGWNKLADLNHFVVLYPKQKLLNNSSLCFNWFYKKDIEKHIEDINRKEFKDSLGETVVILYEINNLGHKLLIKPGNKENEKIAMPVNELIHSQKYL